MMVKNEHARIEVSLNSVRNIVDNFVILDTGSEDDTVQIIKNYCDKYSIPLHLLQQTFPHPFHFSNARNSVLDFADDKGDYLLLLDCNDELRGGEHIKKFVDENKNNNISAFHICQEWWNGKTIDKYYNVRMLKSKNGWRYKGAIHEYIAPPENEPREMGRVFGFSLYQDRTLDDDKSFKRFSRDEEVLDMEYEDNLKKIKEGKLKSQDPRTIFYYGQTCMCLYKQQKSYMLYRERTELEGFTEERFHAYLRCGDLSEVLKHSWEETIIWYIKAYEYSAKTFKVPRAEPLYKIAKYYQDKCWELSFLYLKRCCELPYPLDAILFVDRRLYDYSRWNLMGIVGYYAKEFNSGRQGCCNAIVSEKLEEDIKNLKFYVEDENEREKLITTLKNMEKIDTTIPIPNTVPTITKNEVLSAEKQEKQEKPEMTTQQRLQKKMKSLRNLRKGK